MFVFNNIIDMFFVAFLNAKFLGLQNLMFVITFK